MPAVNLRDVVKTYDIRGLVDVQLDTSVCTALGSAFAQVVAIPEGHDEIAVGRDMRESSPALAAAFIAGVTRHGVRVVDIGLCSTDGLYFASGTRGIPGAMFTASHNPSAYNGIKLCRSGARPVGTGTGLEEVRDLAQWLIDRGETHALVPASTDPASGQGGPLVVATDIGADYAAFLHGLVDLNRSRELTVVVDAGNGMAGLTAPGVLASLEHLRVVPMYFELDGTFPNHPANPLEPDNLRDLQRAVADHGADLGLAFDGDADRCAVVDETGAVVDASAITALIAEREIARAVAGGADPGDVTVVHNLICSRAVPERIAAAGAHALRTKVGHSLIKAQMHEHGAVFGGEHSAHYYFRDFWYADSGMLAALHVLSALGESDRPLSSLMEQYQPYVSSGEINSTVPDGARAAVTEQIEAWGSGMGAVADHLDGLTLTWDDPAPDPGSDSVAFWSVSVRASNTEPLFRLNVEADEKARMESIRDTVRGMMDPTSR